MASSGPSITILTEYFYPEEASTAQLLTELSAGLTDKFDVSVVTGFPNYHDEDRTQSVPKQSSHRGVNIRRIRATRFDKDSIPLRAVNWLSFTLLSFLHLLRNDKEAVLVLSNPPILPLAAFAANRFRDVSYAYLIYDMYPDMPINLGIIDADGIVVRLWERAMRAVYRDADRIVVLGDSMERRLVEKMSDHPSFDPGKIEIIANWEDGDFIRPMDKEDNDFAREHDTVEKFTLLYSGNIGRYHELETAIDAIGELERRGREDIQLLIIGEGARKDELRRRVQRKGIENVRFLPFQPMERLPETLTCGDASLVGINPEMEGMCVSSKLYSALAAGRPVLAVVGEGDEVARVVSQSNSGEHVDPGDVEEAADVLESWANDPDLADRLGANARDVFEENYTREHAVEAYEELFEEMTGKVGSGYRSFD
jgi:glycosyltransferase involved in cell wall biosynthesis